MAAIIGILAQIDDEKNATLASAYARAIENSGGIPMVFPYTDSQETLDKLIKACGGILFSGGCDIDPKYYGEAASALCGTTQRYRDELEFAVFRKAIAAGKPIMGICRGAQLINVALGGTLYQDIPSEYATDIIHRQKEDKTQPSHGVNIVGGTPLYELVGKDSMIANSFHHQAVKKPGENLRVMAKSDDGIIEAMYLPGYSFLRAYQWHPERLCEQNLDNKSLFDEFIESVLK